MFDSLIECQEGRSMRFERVVYVGKNSHEERDGKKASVKWLVENRLER